MPTFKSLAVALALVLAAVPAAMAGPPDRGDTPGGGRGPGGGWGPGGNRPSVGVPGPVAGVGLPILAVAGGLVWILARKRRADRTGP